MSSLRVHSFAISLDACGAGPNQDLNNPLGVGGMALHEWMFGTRTFRQMVGKVGGATGTDGDFVARGFEPIGARILGRNRFGPIRESWPDDSWKGWWGENPPYHNRFRPPASPARIARTEWRHDVPLCHRWHSRRTRTSREGGEGSGRPPGRWRRYNPAIPSRRSYRQMHLAMSPVLLGSGECLLEGIDAPKLGYHRTEHVATPNATHFVIAKRT
jgi:dihydrofolate reductase